MRIESKVKSYSAEVVDNLLDTRDGLLSQHTYDRLFYFVDDAFYSLYEDKLKSFIKDDFCLRIPAFEQNKEYAALMPYYNALIEARFTRKDILITFGGGILQDISGFIASTLYRGLKWVFFPTTLLAQADSCIGSKTSINLGDSKNLIGSFYPPDAIYIDPSFCDTLSDAYFNSGIGEIIKFHLLSDAQGYARLKQYLDAGDIRKNQYFGSIVESTLAIKKSYFEGDEFDSGRRNLLNYGHCLGHALESASDFGVSHGEAVMVGMGFANVLSVKRGIMTKEVHDEFHVLIKPYYPAFDLAAVSVDDLIYYLKRDKKRVGKDLTMILARDVGNAVKCTDITEQEIRETYTAFCGMYADAGAELTSR